MPKFFDPTPEQRGELEAIAAAIPGVQKTFVLNHPHVKTPDRGAHQQQIAAFAHSINPPRPDIAERHFSL